MHQQLQLRRLISFWTFTYYVDKYHIYISQRLFGIDLKIDTNMQTKKILFISQKIMKRAFCIV